MCLFLLIKSDLQLTVEKGGFVEGSAFETSPMSASLQLNQQSYKKQHGIKRPGKPPHGGPIPPCCGHKAFNTLFNPRTLALVTA